MCSFLLINQVITNLAFVNYYLQLRGPDATTHTRFEGYDFVHNLLHMTGTLHHQPFVSGRRIALFNGEIYNWRRLAELQLGIAAGSDGDVILPLYEAFGADFPRALYGEFAIAVVDFEKDLAMLVSDVFSTKPMWYALLPEENRFAVATYQSALLRLDFPRSSIRMVGPNRFLQVQLSTLKVVRESTLFEFDLRQYKTTLDDFVTTFHWAVKLRTEDLIATRHPLFIGLSTGYDSGAIQASLLLQNIEHFAIGLLAEEAADIFEDRAKFSVPTAEVNLVAMCEEDWGEERTWLRNHVEPGAYTSFNDTGQVSLHHDYAAIGLSYIVRVSRDRGALCYLSGTGADEIFSDYAWAGRAWAGQSSFGGIYPDELSDIFPWKAFFLSSQRDYLVKEEHVAGAHGVEGRYPFLDPRLIQEFLWLTPEAKNSEYKVGLAEIFDSAKYPYMPREKLGFSAKANLMRESSRIWRWGYLGGDCGLPPPSEGTETVCETNDAGMLNCEVQCAPGFRTVEDTLRCGHRGSWVGRVRCEEEGWKRTAGQRELTKRVSKIWPPEGPQPPVPHGDWTAAAAMMRQGERLH